MDYGDNFHTSTDEQHAEHDAHAIMFCVLVETLIKLANSHKDKRVRSAAKRSIASFALLKADPSGANALCGPKVKQAIERATMLVIYDPKRDSDLFPELSAKIQ